MISSNISAFLKILEWSGVELQADLLKRAQSRCEQLIRYVNDLLDITKLKLTRQLTLEPFSWK